MKDEERNIRRTTAAADRGHQPPPRKRCFRCLQERIGRLQENYRTRRRSLRNYWRALVYAVHEFAWTTEIMFRVSNSSTAVACACTLAQTVICSSECRTTFFTFCFKCYFHVPDRQLHRQLSLQLSNKAFGHAAARPPWTRRHTGHECRSKWLCCRQQQLQRNIRISTDWSNSWQIDCMQYCSTDYSLCCVHCSRSKLTWIYSRNHFEHLKYSKNRLAAGALWGFVSMDDDFHNQTNQSKTKKKLTCFHVLFCIKADLSNSQMKCAL